jgi:hypothetical protein
MKKKTRFDTIPSPTGMQNDEEVCGNRGNWGMLLRAVDIVLGFEEDDDTDGDTSHVMGFVEGRGRENETRLPGFGSSPTLAPVPRRPSAPAGDSGGVEGISSALVPRAAGSGSGVGAGFCSGSGFRFSSTRGPQSRLRLAKCHLCHFSCSRSMPLVLHVRFQHWDDFLFDRLLPGTGSVLRPVRRHRHRSLLPSELRFPCDFCKFGGSTLRSLMCHRHRHTGERPFVCSIVSCRARFPSPSALANHMRGHK